MTDNGFQLGIMLLVFGGFLTNIETFGSTGLVFGLILMLFGLTIGALDVFTASADE
jgi:hypothetical protein